MGIEPTSESWEQFENNGQFRRCCILVQLGKEQLGKCPAKKGNNRSQTFP
jgi:hypothetical protein